MAEDHNKDDKHAKPPPKPARPSRDDDDDEAPAKPSGSLKQKTLATALSRAIVISTLLGATAYTASTLFSARYALIQAPNTSNNFIYRLDRLTGGVQFCGQQQCVDVIHAESPLRADRTEK